MTLEIKTEEQNDRPILLCGDRMTVGFLVDTLQNIPRDYKLIVCCSSKNGETTSHGDLKAIGRSRKNKLIMLIGEEDENY